MNKIQPFDASGRPADITERSPREINGRVEIQSSSEVQYGGAMRAVLVAMVATVVGVGVLAWYDVSGGIIFLVALVSAFIMFQLLRAEIRSNAEIFDKQGSDYRAQQAKWRARFDAISEQAIQASASLEKMRDGVVLLADSGEILLINPAACSLLAIETAQDLIGTRFGDVVRIPELAKAISAAQPGDHTQVCLIEVVSNNNVRPVKATINRFHARAGEKVLVALSDETEVHRLDEMRREFVANISHELKTPLAAIKGYAETVELALEDDPDAARHFMRQINSQCLRLEKLIADMMQLARAQAGRSYLSITSVDLSQIVGEAVKTYQPVADARNIELISSTIPGSVVSDREATLTIVNNLIGNAIRYTDDHGHVKVGCRPAGDCLAVFVQDNGIGIPEGEQERIFERFYRVEGSRRSAAEGGTGIGLSIVKNLALAMGGAVRVQSRPGEGSEFEVQLPKAIGDVRESQENRSQE